MTPAAPPLRSLEGECTRSHRSSASRLLQLYNLTFLFEGQGPWIRHDIWACVFERTAMKTITRKMQTGSTAASTRRLFRTWECLYVSALAQFICVIVMMHQRATPRTMIPAMLGQSKQQEYSWTHKHSYALEVEKGSRQI